MTLITYSRTLTALICAMESPRVTGRFWASEEDLMSTVSGDSEKMSCPDTLFARPGSPLMVRRRLPLKKESPDPGKILQPESPRTVKRYRKDTTTDNLDEQVVKHKENKKKTDTDAERESVNTKRSKSIKISPEPSWNEEDRELYYDHDCEELSKFAGEAVMKINRIRQKLIIPHGAISAELKLNMKKILRIVDTFAYKNRKNDKEKENLMAQIQEIKIRDKAREESLLKLQEENSTLKNNIQTKEESNLRKEVNIIKGQVNTIIAILIERDTKGKNTEKPNTKETNTIGISNLVEPINHEKHTNWNTIIGRKTNQKKRENPQIIMNNDNSKTQKQENNGNKKLNSNKKTLIEDNTDTLIKEKNRKEKIPRTSAVFIKIREGGPSIAEFLCLARQKINLSELGIASQLRIRNAFNGGTIIEIYDDDTRKKAEILCSRLKEICPLKVRITVPIISTVMRLTNIDGSINRENLILAIKRKTETRFEDITVSNIVTSRNGLGIAWVKCPPAAALKIKDICLEVG